MGIWLRYEEKRIPKVKDFLRKDFIQLDAGESVWKAALEMKRRNMGSAIVTLAGEPVGIVTERDILYKVAAEDLVASTITLRKIMSSPIITVSDDTPVKEAIKIMEAKKIRRLLVTSGGKPVGLVSQRAVVGDSLGTEKAVQELDFPD
jgi:CBS domain-containing protein